MLNLACNFCASSFQAETKRTHYCSRFCRSRASYQRNKKERIARLQARYKNDSAYREKIKRATREGYKKDPEKRRLAARKYAADPVKANLIRNYQKWYRKNNKEKLQLKMKRARHRRRTLYPWRSCLDNAKKSVQSKPTKKHLLFDLTDAWAAARWTGKCELTGIAFVIPAPSENNKMLWPSIDRIDSKVGYTQTNCRFILLAINSFRMDGTDAEMLLIARALVQNIHIPPA